MTPGKWKYKKPEATPGKQCKDCVAGGFGATKRPAPHPGPRCATHHRAKIRADRLARSVKHVERTYDLTEEEYDALYQYQGGRCYICRRAKGTGRRRLAVDHDHALARTHDHPETQGCKLCARGLLCQRCNQDVVGHLRDDPEAGRRLTEYLTSPPWLRLVYGGHHE